MLLVRLRSPLVSSFLSGVLACSLPVAASASRHGVGAAARPEPGFRLHFGRTAQSGNEPFRPFVVPTRKQIAPPTPPADLPEFVRNPLRLRRMAYDTQPTADR
jgi:hypothetical protein